jgi:hypothetical protein
MIKLVPLKDPKNKASGVPSLGIMTFLAYPVSLQKDPKTGKPVPVPTQDTGNTCRFFRALYGESFPIWPAFKKKGQSQKEHEAEREACVKAAIKAFSDLHEKPGSTKTWVVEGRLHTKEAGGFQNKSFYDEGYLKSLKPGWAYSEVRSA